jgi:predicted phosphoribosyltransferase/alpha/beta superfamily hydrolase
VDAGIAAFLLDFTGHGDSEGDIDESTLGDQEGDLGAALDLLAAQEFGSLGIAGSSSGGAVALAVAARDSRIGALVLRAPSAAARLSLAARLEVPTLVIQGENDALVERSRVLVGALHCEHRLCLVPGAGHLFEEPGTFEAALEETVRWFRRWLAGENANAGGEHRAGSHYQSEPAPSHFADRAEAGRELAKRLVAYRGPGTLVLALPRGGIAVAEPIVEALECDLDVFVSRKVRAPYQPELAIGAVAEGGVVLWNEELLTHLAVADSAREWQLAQARRELEERLATYRAVLPRADIKDRTVIVTDDGIATGATLKAALVAIAGQGALRLIVALPGGPARTLDEIRAFEGVDEVIALSVPEFFVAVGQLYDSFAQVSADEVCDALRRSRERRSALAAAAAE